MYESDSERSNIAKAGSHGETSLQMVTGKFYGNGLSVYPKELFPPQHFARRCIVVLQLTSSYHYHSQFHLKYTIKLTTDKLTT